MEKTLPLSLCLISSLLVGPSLRADDVAPPSYRGDPLSVYLVWNNVDLVGPPYMALPDVAVYVDDNNPETYLFVGDTFLPILHLPPPDIPLPDLPRPYRIEIPNWVDDMPVKKGRIQITLAGPVDATLTRFDAFENGRLLPPPSYSIADGILGGTWIWDFEIRPNPDWEIFAFTVPGGTVVTQIVVDTVSVPEPGVIGLVSLGILGTLAVCRRPRRSQPRV